ncbi:MAG: DUF4149 domain-containing protein [Verrucomicrobiae bacterium]|nr:DUF4149 domain-containing protein [Verrucomicrobiae bacterium]
MQSTLRLILTLLLGFWLGASVFFSFVSAPTLFQLAKTGAITREQAGDIAVAMLNKYFISGLAILSLATIVSATLAFGASQPRYTRPAIILVIAVLISAFSTFVWTPQVHAVREQRRANPSAEMDRKFGIAHGVSSGMNLLVIIGTAWAFVIVARPE